MASIIDRLLGRETNPVEQRQHRSNAHAHAFVNKNTPVVDKSKAKPERDKPLPITGGRSSVPDGYDYLSPMINGNGLGAETKPEWLLGWLDALYHLAMYNSDVSFAVENIVNLGATDYKMYFKDNTPEALQKEILLHIKTRSKEWYPYSGGMDSLVNDLFAELAIAGCISQEIVVAKDLSGVEQIVKVSPTKVRFIWDARHGRYMPFQKVALIGGFSMSTTDGDYHLGMKRLNPVTYKYIALRRFKDNPYTVPPFLSAIEPLIMQRGMMDSFAAIMKKMGLAGFLRVLVQAPPRVAGEAAEAYYSRMKTYLENEVAPEVDKQMGKGYAVGFKGTHEYDVANVSQNAQGAETFFDMNEKTVISGLKQDPAMLGRQMTTTETFGRVILAKLTNQTVNFQKLVASFIEDVIHMELLLAGYDPDVLDYIQFDKPMVGDQDKEESARGKQIDNSQKLVDAGLISRTQQAQELGYDKPFMDDDAYTESKIPKDPITGEPIVPENDSPENPTPDAAKTENARFRLGNTMADYARAAAFNLHKGTEEFDYSMHHKDEIGDGKDWYERFAASDGWNDPKLEKMLKEYVTGTKKQYDKATTKSAVQVLDALAKMPADATLQEVRDKVMYTLFRNWKGNFSKEQQALIDDMVEKTYNTFRADKTLFGKAKKVPEAVFNTRDQRTKQYFKKSDDLYLGKFITDKDTRQRIFEFLKEEYIGENTPIGNNTAAFDDFRNRFKDLMDMEDYKIRRIVDTSVNKMRNYASVNYMAQADVTEFQIVGVDDKRTCEWCKSMQNRTFTVEAALQTIEEELSSGVEDIPLKFLTSKFKAADMEAMTDAALQKAGYSKPPYHPLCRDSIVAVI